MKNRLVSVYCIIGLWIAIFVLESGMNLMGAFGGVSVSQLHGQVYRYVTASFLHGNLLHLVANCLALYFATIYLDGKVSNVTIVAVGMLGATLTNVVEGFWVNVDCVFGGGSPFIFALLGLIVTMQFRREQFPPFRLGTWYGNWTLGYVILGNLWNGNGQFLEPSNILTHGIAFVMGVLIGAVFLFFGGEKA